MGQHFHNIVSHTALHIEVLFLHLDNSQTTPWWYWLYEKIKTFRLDQSHKYAKKTRIYKEKDYISH